MVRLRCLGSHIMRCGLALTDQLHVLAKECKAASNVQPPRPNSQRRNSVLPFAPKWHRFVAMTHGCKPVPVSRTTCGDIKTPSNTIIGEIMLGVEDEQTAPSGPALL
jgi:hypothetical protein